MIYKKSNCLKLEIGSLFINMISQANAVLPDPLLADKTCFIFIEKTIPLRNT